MAAFHVVVGVFKHAAHDKAARAAHGVGAQAFEGGEELVIHKIKQLVAGDAFGIRRPVAPAHLVRNRAGVGVAREFKLFFEGIKHFEKQQPGELTDALGVAIDAAVLAHDVLNGFDGAGEVGHEVF